MFIPSEIMLQYCHLAVNDTQIIFIRSQYY